MVCGTRTLPSPSANPRRMWRLNGNIHSLGTLALTLIESDHTSNKLSRFGNGIDSLVSILWFVINLKSARRYRLFYVTRSMGLVASDQVVSLSVTGGCNPLFALCSLYVRAACDLYYSTYMPGLTES